MPTRQEAIAALTAAGPFELTLDATEGEPPLRVYTNAPASLREVLKSRSRPPRFRPDRAAR